MISYKSEEGREIEGGREEFDYCRWIWIGEI